MNQYGHLFYTKLYEKDLELMIKHDISKQGMRLYLFLSLNFNTFNQFTVYLNDTEIAESLGTHRTTVMRARAELEAAGLIVEDTETSIQTYRYHLPYKAKVDSKANQKRKENKEKASQADIKKKQKEREKEYSRTRQQMENRLSRRLTVSEVATLKKNLDVT